MVSKTITQILCGSLWLANAAREAEQSPYEFVDGQSYRGLAPGTQVLCYRERPRKPTLSLALEVSHHPYMEGQVEQGLLLTEPDRMGIAMIGTGNYWRLEKHSHIQRVEDERYKKSRGANLRITSSDPTIYIKAEDPEALLKVFTSPEVELRELPGVFKPSDEGYWLLNGKPDDYKAGEKILCHGDGRYLPLDLSRDRNMEEREVGYLVRSKRRGLVIDIPGVDHVYVLDGRYHIQKVEDEQSPANLRLTIARITGLWTIYFEARDPEKLMNAFISCGVKASPRAFRGELKLRCIDWFKEDGVFVYGDIDIRKFGQPALRFEYADNREMTNSREGQLEFDPTAMSPMINLGNRCKITMTKKAKGQGWKFYDRTHPRNTVYTHGQPQIRIKEEESSGWFQAAAREYFLKFEDTSKIKRFIEALKTDLRFRNKSDSKRNCE